MLTIGRSAVLMIAHQLEGLLCSPLCVSGRVCCDCHCFSSIVKYMLLVRMIGMPALVQA